MNHLVCNPTKTSDARRLILWYCVEVAQNSLHDGFKIPNHADLAYDHRMLLWAATLSFIDIMCFNVRFATANDGENRWELRRAFCIEVIREASPDLLLVQEALKSQVDEILTAMPDYEHFGCGRDDAKEAGEYSAIFFKKGKFKLVSSGWFWLSDTPEVPGSATWGNRVTRICTWAIFEFQDRRIAVYNTHLDHESQNSREKSVSMIAKHMSEIAKDLPIIYGGDFNAGESNKAIAMIYSESHRRFADTFRVIHPSATDVGTFHAFTGSTKGDKIDYIFVSEHWKVLAAGIDRRSSEGRYPSDHFPITARVQLAEFGPQ